MMEYAPAIDRFVYVMSSIMATNYIQSRTLQQVIKLTENKLLKQWPLVLKYVDDFAKVVDMQALFLIYHRLYVEQFFDLF